MSTPTPALPAHFVARPYEGRTPIVARDGWSVIAAFVFPTLGVLIAGLILRQMPVVGPTLLGLAFALALLSGWAIWFFRDPDRAPPAGENLDRALLCPADGVVVKVESASPPPEARADERPLVRVCVFMNVFNVHVNRSPCAGTVEAIHYHHGAFLNASFDKASELNERAAMVVRRDDGARLIVVQIAGLVARRIVSKVRTGQRLGPGERYGLIKFGSRVDLYLPEGFEPAVRVGQKVTAGVSVLARVRTASPT